MTERAPRGSPAAAGMLRVVPRASRAWSTTCDMHAPAAAVFGGPRVSSAMAYSAEPGGGAGGSSSGSDSGSSSSAGSDTTANPQTMHPLVRDLFKRFLYVGRDYPLPPPYVRDKAREAILKNKDLTDPREVGDRGEGRGRRAGVTGGCASRSSRRAKLVLGGIKLERPGSPRYHPHTHGADNRSGEARAVDGQGDRRCYSAQKVSGPESAPNP